MALMDYQKLCPKSGHALTNEEREALAAKDRAPGRERTIRCEACNRTVEVCLHPGTRQSLIYAMHVRNGAEPRLDQAEPSR
jgi:hypothetical protein